MALHPRRTAAVAESINAALAQTQGSGRTLDEAATDVLRARNDPWPNAGVPGCCR